MAKEAVLSILAQIKGDYSNFINGAKQAKNIFSQLNLGKELTKQLDQGYQSIINNSANFEKKLAEIEKKGINNTNVKGLSDEFRALVKSGNDFYQTWSKITEKDLQNTTFNSSDIVKVKKQIGDIRTEIGLISKEAGGPIEKLRSLMGGLSKNSGTSKGIQSIIDSFASGDLSKVQEQIDKLIKLANTNAVASQTKLANVNAELQKQQDIIANSEIAQKGLLSESEEYKALEQAITNAELAIVKLQKEQQTYSQSGAIYTNIANQAQQITNAFSGSNEITALQDKIKLLEQEIVRLQEELQNINANKISESGEQIKKSTNEIKATGEAFGEVAGSALKASGEVEQLVSRFTRFTTLAGIIDIFKKSITSAFNAVKELDSAMNSIAVVTDMTTQDLWDQIDAYTELANATGSTITGAYQVAQLYYQQGLSTNEVLTMTEETLKLARIAGIDYANATDYMTAAIKGFGLAYEDVTRVMDVYSNLAARSAADTEEISIAMSKVASIAHSTGMELETTAAFLTQIIATTREAPETAGTALKTVVARFAEVKNLVSQGETTGTTDEGEEVDVNKIETALKSVGVSLRDTTGQMRDLDDVFIELASKWNSLDTITQRYIATQAAGSRQQSRFLAMMNDYEGLMETLGYATDSAGASNEQFAKTMDSLESKINALKNAWTEFTTGLTDSGLIKGAVDLLTNIINGINDLTGNNGLAKAGLLFGSLRLAAGSLGSTLQSLGFNIEKLGLTTLKSSIGKGLVSNFINARKNIILYTSSQDEAIAKTILLNGVTFKANTQELLYALSTEGLTEAKRKEIIADLAQLGVTNKLIIAYYSLSAAKRTALRVAGAVIAIIAATIAIIKKFTVSLSEAKENWSEYTQELQEVQKETNNTKDSISELQDVMKGYYSYDPSTKQETTIKTIQELVNGTDEYGNSINLTSEELENYNDILQRLVDVGFGDSIQDVISKLKSETGETKNATQAIEDYIETLKIQIKTEAWARQQNRTNSDKTSEKKNAKDTAQNYIRPEDQEYQITNFDSLQNLTINEQNRAKLYEPFTNYQLDMLNFINSTNIVAYRASLEKAKELGETEYANLLQSWIDAYDRQNQNAKDYAESQFNKTMQELASSYTLDYAYANKNIVASELAQQTDIEQYLLDNFFNEENAQRIADDYDNFIKEVQDEINKIGSIDWSEINSDDKLREINQKKNNYKDFSSFKEDFDQAIQNIIDDVKKIGVILTSEQIMSLFGMSSGELSENNPIVQSLAFFLGKTSNEIISMLSQLPVDIYQEISVGNITWDQIFTTFGRQIEDGTINVIEAITQYVKDNKKIFNKSQKELIEYIDNVNEAWDNLEEIDLSDLSDGIKDNVDYINLNISKIFEDANWDPQDYSMDFQKLVQSMQELDNTSENVFSNLGYSAEQMASAFAAAKAQGLDFKQILFQLIANGNKELMTTIGIDADVDYMVAAAQAQVLLNQARAGATKLELQEIDLAKAIAGLGKTSSSSSGGGGGGGEPAKASMDAFYNYIKMIEKTEKALESLQDEQELLTDPEQIRQNIDGQIQEYQRLVSENRGYADAVEAQLLDAQTTAMEKYSDYLQIAEDGSLRLTEAYYSLTGGVVEELDDWIDSYDDLLGRQDDLNDELIKYKKELQKLFNGWRDDYIDLEDQIVDILKEADEKMLEEKQDYYDELEKQSEEYLDAVRKNIQAERDARDTANSYEEIGKKEKRLALLQRDTSGRYNNEIMQLQEEINQAQQDLADEMIDGILNDLEDQMDLDSKRHSEIIDKMQEQIDNMVENRGYIEEADRIIEEGDQAIIDALISGQEYQEASDAARNKMMEEWTVQIANANQYLVNVQQGIVDAAKYIESALWSSLQSHAQAVVGAFFQTESSSGNSGNGRGSGTTSKFGTNDTTLTSKDLDNDYYGTYDMEATITRSQGGYNVLLDGKIIDGNLSYDEANKLKNKLNHYANGGLVDYTGPAWVDGTKSSPEAFLNANQTSIIGNFARNLEKISNSSGSSGILGGDCNINIDIGNLGADYDIDQAIAKVKNEIITSTQYRNVNVLKRSR